MTETAIAYEAGPELARRHPLEVSPVGGALAAAWRAGDWSDAMEARAREVLDGSVPESIRGVAWLSGGRVFARRGYEPAYTDEAHKRTGRLWHGEPELQAWSFKPAAALGSWLSRWGVELSPLVEEACFRPQQHRRHETRDEKWSHVPRPQQPTLIRVETEPLTWRLTGDLRGALVAAWLRDAPGTTTLDAEKSGYLICPNGDLDASYDWALRAAEAGIRSRQLEEWTVELERARHKATFETDVWDASRAITPTGEVSVAMGLTLRPDQLAAVEYVWHRATVPGRCLIGDEVGVGKSPEALACAEYRGAFPLLVVCPAGLIVNWRHEALKWLPHRTVDVCTTRSGAIGVADITVIGYEALGKRLDPIVRTEWGGVVVDEAHYIKNPRATRSVNVLVATEGIDGMRLAMSGTFVKNKDHDADFPLRMIGRADVAQRCRDDRPDQAAILRGECMVRRKKSDVWENLPPLQAIKTYVEPEPAAWKEYLKAEAEIIEYVKQRAAEIARKLGLDPHAEAVKAALRAQGAEELVRISHLRRLAGLAKRDAAVEMARRFAEETGRPLILFAHHLDVIDMLAKSLGCPKIIGGMSAAERQDIVDRFQAGEFAAVAIGFQAGGVGLTLSAASDMLLLEQQWTPADMEQAYGRAHARAGAFFHGLIANHLVIEDSIDEMMMDLIEEKREMASQMMDGEEATKLMGQSIAGDLLVKLWERGGE